MNSPHERKFVMLLLLIRADWLFFCKRQNEMCFGLPCANLLNTFSIPMPKNDCTRITAE